MRISVIMPCHNAGPWVRAALESIAAQNRPADQIIVVNDASTDDSVAQIEASGVDVDLVHTRQGAPGRARNVGLERADGDWIAFLDADDAWHPEHLEQAAALIDQGDDIGVTGLDDWLFMDGSTRPGANPFPITEPTTGLTADQCIEWWSNIHRFAMSTTLVHRGRLEEIGRFDPDLNGREDIDMWLKLLHGRTWALNPRPTSLYRVTPGSNSREDWAESEYYFLRVLLDNLPLYADDANYRRLVRRAASKSIAAALTDGDREDLLRVKDMAWPHLPPKRRLAFRMGVIAPPAFRAANKLRRRLRGKRAVAG